VLPFAVLRAAAWPIETADAFACPELAAQAADDSTATVDAAYARLKRPMRGQVHRLASRVAVRLTSDFEHARTLVGGALLARLGHTQAVRVRGPGRSEDLGWEAGLARRLAQRAPGKV